MSEEIIRLNEEINRGRSGNWSAAVRKKRRTSCRRKSRNRPLQGRQYPYVCADGIYLRRNRG
jgi:hypothetical protein